MAFAHGFFKQNIREPGAASEAAHLRQAAKQLGRSTEDVGLVDVTGLPGGCEFVWDVFSELNITRQAGFAPNPITYQEILAWVQLTGLMLEPWEVSALKQLDVAFLDEAGKKINRKKPGEQ